MSLGFTRHVVSPRFKKAALIAFAVVIATALVVVLVRKQSAVPKLATELVPSAVAYSEASGNRQPPSRLGRYVCVMQALGISVASVDVRLYVWSRCGRFLPPAAAPTGSDFTSGPEVFSFRKTARGYEAFREQEPRDSPYYAPDVKRLFPRSVSDRILAAGSLGPSDASLEARAKFVLARR